MRLYRGREYRINLDHYEHTTVTAGVTVDHGDLGYTDEQVVAMSDEERAALQDALQEEAEAWLARATVNELKASAQDADARSFVHKLFPNTTRPSRRRS